MNESALLRSLRLELGKRDDVVLWRNNVGLAWYRKGGGQPIRCPRCSHTIALNETPVRYGLCNGSSDLIGLQLGTGRFIAGEAKAEGGRFTPEQARFLTLVNKMGGIGVELRDAQDLIVRL